jgi:hypothetical protein
MVTKRDREIEVIKQAFKEASKEFLEEKFTHLGKWTARSIAAAALVGIVYFILWTNGWHR